MNSRILRGSVITLFLSVALLISACGTLQIDTEPAASGAEVVAPATEASQPTLTPTVEAIPSLTEVIPSPAEADDVVDETQPLTAVNCVCDLLANGCMISICARYLPSTLTCA